MQGVHARDGAGTARTVETVFDDFTDDQVGIIVAFPGALLEFAGGMQQTADPRRREGAEQRKFERACGIPGKDQRRQMANDLLAIASRVRCQAAVHRFPFGGSYSFVFIIPSYVPRGRLDAATSSIRRRKGKTILPASSEVVNKSTARPICCVAQSLTPRLSI